MPNYVDRDALRDALYEADAVTMEGVKIINNFPTADVRHVVTCKDCVYSDKWYRDRLICYLWDEHDGDAVFEDGFCNYGKEREES